MRADEMSEDDQIGRKYRKRAPPPPVPDEPVPSVPPQPDPQRQSTQQAGSTPGLASIQVPASVAIWGQNDTIGKIELKPSIVLSSDNTNSKNDIQLFHQLFDELSVYRDYH